MKNIIFPEIIDKKWAEVSLDAFAQRDFPDGENPLLDAQKCDEWVNKIAKECNADFTYGGYLEDRSHLWRGHYLPAGPQAHLGVDYNVPAGVRVASCVAGTVVHTGKDGQWGGWGGIVIIRIDQPPMKGADYLYYGHLCWDNMISVGAQVKPDDTIGFIGEPHQNGQWFPHLHLQLVSEAKFSAVKEDPLMVDGYLAPPVPSEDFPDPRSLVLL